MITKPSTFPISQVQTEIDTLAATAAQFCKKNPNHAGRLNEYVGDAIKALKAYSNNTFYNSYDPHFLEEISGSSFTKESIVMILENTDISSDKVLVQIESILDNRIGRKDFLVIRDVELAIKNRGNAATLNIKNSLRWLTDIIEIKHSHLNPQNSFAPNPNTNLWDM
ncbi:MAG: hypothetical protein KME32_33905 [Mojavia pulchra JT2-VF2]|jgi:hypothetical protein|uniref:Uncharacterized protein n=1 Tax=Mojavia pulchra JT2-VF2 TaxID=287848 RepID=A0A951Q620_9NOST|nr:hypothetical protein [Mojavia pulchra JT2-VF2]